MDGKRYNTNNDLLDINGEIITFNTFRTNFSVNTNVLQFEGLIRSIKDYIFSFSFEPLLYRQDYPIRPYSLSCILRNQKGCRNIYDNFLVKDKPPTSVPKWQNDLNLSSQFDWKNIFGLPFKVTKDTNLRWLQTRINHRILGTNYLLLKMNLKATDKCTFCLEEKETVKHIFWDCECVAYFWDGLKLLIQDNCGQENIDFTVTDIIFGNPNFEDLLNEILLLGKRFIYRMKMENQRPSLICFRKTITSHYKTDKYIAVKSQTQHNFEQKWDKYKELL